MSLGMYVLIDGIPVPEPDPVKWGNWWKSEDRTIGLTILGDVRVSTVFLGLDHSFLGGPPLLYETMVFGGELDREQERYSTAEEALQGHRDMVERVKATLPDPEVHNGY